MMIIGIDLGQKGGIALLADGIAKALLIGECARRKLGGGL